MTVKEFTESHKYMTIGDLRKAIKDKDDNNPVMIQRITDYYFENGWETLRVESGDEGEYIPAWSVCEHSEAKDILFIDAHY